jgi:hypothetical protein
MDLALRGQIVDFRGPGFLDDSHQVRCVGEIAAMQEEPNVVIVRILIEMINAFGVERGRASLPLTM